MGGFHIAAGCVVETDRGAPTGERPEVRRGGPRALWCWGRPRLCRGAQRAEATSGRLISPARPRPCWISSRSLEQDVPDTCARCRGHGPRGHLHPLVLLAHPSTTV